MDRLLLDQYEILRELGRGGMGTVYEANDVRNGRHVAIKWLHTRPFSDDDPELRRFEQEAKIASRLNCPHITSVLDLERDPESGVVFQVMELHKGQDLSRLLKQVGPLPPETALRIAAQAAKGLAAAHAAGVVHRDIKPANLFLAYRDNGEVLVKLLDFGVAKIRPRPDHAQISGAMTAPAVPMTTSGQMLGTPLFMAPEQIDSAKNVDERSDVYSMGITLYAMLAGAPPHAEISSLMRLLQALVTEPPPPLSQSAPWVAPEIAAIVERATSPQKEDRYANGKALLDAMVVLLPDGFDLRQEMLIGLSDAQKSAVIEASAPARAPAIASAPALETPKASTPRLGILLGLGALFFALMLALAVLLR